LVFIAREARYLIDCCTGNPCAECAAHNRECVYDELADKRRKVAAKRTQEELDYYRGFLERLLDSIRYCEPGHIDQIINIIRGGASLDEILSVVEQSLNQVRGFHEKDKAQGGEAEVEEGGEATTTMGSMRGSTDGVLKSRKMIELTEK
jgi:hypothetical protein